MSWEHQVDKYEKLAGSTLDDAKLSVVIREAPTKFRDHMLVVSPQFEGKYNQLSIVIQTKQNSNKKSAVGDFRNEDKAESLDSGAGPMDLDHISLVKARVKAQ